MTINLSFASSAELIVDLSICLTGSTQTCQSVQSYVLASATKNQPERSVERATLVHELIASHWRSLQAKQGGVGGRTSVLLGLTVLKLIHCSRDLTLFFSLVMRHLCLLSQCVCTPSRAELAASCQCNVEGTKQIGNPCACANRAELMCCAEASACRKLCVYTGLAGRALKENVNCNCMMNEEGKSKRKRQTRIYLRRSYLEPLICSQTTTTCQIKQVDRIGYDTFLH